MAVPKAAVDFPLPSPVLTSTSDGSRTVAFAGGSVGGTRGSATRHPRGDHRGAITVDNDANPLSVVGTEDFLG